MYCNLDFFVLLLNTFLISVLHLSFRPLLCIYISTGISLRRKKFVLSGFSNSRIDPDNRAPTVRLRLYSRTNLRTSDFLGNRFIAFVTEDFFEGFVILFVCPEMYM